MLSDESQGSDRAAVIRAIGATRRACVHCSWRTPIELKIRRLRTLPNSARRTTRATVCRSARTSARARADHDQGGAPRWAPIHAACCTRVFHRARSRGVGVTPRKAAARVRRSLVARLTHTTTHQTTHGSSRRKASRDGRGGHEQTHTYPVKPQYREFYSTARPHYCSGMGLVRQCRVCMQNSGMNAQNGVISGKRLHDAAFMLNPR